MEGKVTCRTSGMMFRMFRHSYLTCGGINFEEEEEEEEGRYGGPGRAPSHRR